MLKDLRKKPLGHRVARGLLLALALTVVTVVCPTPYHLEAPGRVVPVSQIVSVEEDAPTYLAQGKFLLPTVVSEPATLLYCLYGLLDPDARLPSDQESHPQAQSPGPGQFQMALSQQISEIVAFRKLGYDLQRDFLGFRILRVDANSPNRGTLEASDLLIEAGGKRIDSLKTLRRRIAPAEPGKPITLTVLRKGRRVQLQATTYRPHNQSILGVMLKPEYEPLKLPFRVKFQSGNTSGASGGLVFALELYNLFTEEDITGGRIIAATGTLDAAGGVGPVEGVELKLKGAQRAGARWALVPRVNYQELEQVPDGMKVIPVGSFNDALDALEALKN